jgi:hypothetical protein
VDDTHHINADWVSPAAARLLGDVQKHDFRWGAA